MKHRYLVLLALALTPVWGSAPRAGAQLPTNSYTAVNLNGYGYGLNDAGTVVGQAQVPIGEWHASILQGSSWFDLGTLGGTTSSASGINNLGQVVGSSLLAGDINSHAFLWDGTIGMQDLGTLGGDISWAQAMNDAGQVVGTATDAVGAYHAFLWQNGQMVSLAVPNGFADSYANGINASGLIVGTTVDTIGNTWAFRWTPDNPNGTTGTMTILHPTATSYALTINGFGDTVGGAVADTGYWLPQLWDSGGPNALPLLPGALDGIAHAINDSRIVVGYNSWWDEFSYLARAFVWDNLNGVRELDTLAGGSTPYSFDDVGGINTSGQILVYDYTNSTTYLLTPSPLPARPTGLGAWWVNGQVNLAWYGSSGADYYHVKRSSTSGGPYTNIGDVAGTTFTDPTAPSGDLYYVVTAVNEFGESCNSNEAHPVQPPAAPTGLTAAAGDALVSLAWNASSGADLYRVMRATSSGGPYQEVVAVGGTSFIDTGLTNGTTYYYVVVAENAGGQSGYSNQASATPIAPPPAAPTNLTASTANGKKGIDLKWTQSASSRVTQNRVYRSTTSGTGFTLRATISAGTLFTDTGLTPKVTYYYKVTAVSSSGKESAYSNEASAKAR